MTHSTFNYVATLIWKTKFKIKKIATLLNLHKGKLRISNNIKIVCSFADQN